MVLVSLERGRVALALDAGAPGRCDVRVLIITKIFPNAVEPLSAPLNRQLCSLYAAFELKEHVNQAIRELRATGLPPPPPETEKKKKKDAWELDVVDRIKRLPTSPPTCVALGPRRDRCARAQVGNLRGQWKSRLGGVATGSGGVGIQRWSATRWMTPSWTWRRPPTPRREADLATTA